MKALVFTLAMTISAVSFAHGDHPKPVAKCVAKCTKEEIKLAVPAALGSLILNGRIEKDWSAGKVEGIEQKTFSKGPEWVVEVSNTANKTHPKLYVFITTDGFLNGSNYTGK